MDCAVCDGHARRTMRNSNTFSKRLQMREGTMKFPYRTRPPYDDGVMISAAVIEGSTVSLTVSGGCAIETTFHAILFNLRLAIERKYEIPCDRCTAYDVL